MQEEEIRASVDEDEDPTELAHWIKCLAVVCFDLEYGQQMEQLWPPETTFTDVEASTICFLSFPDSHSNWRGDNTFSFRFPRQSDSGVQSESVERVHLNGFVFNRIRKDASLRRGYLQQSFVIITERSDVMLWPFYVHLASLLGTSYFSVGQDEQLLLQSAFRNSLSWPRPAPGKMQEFPILGEVVRTQVVTNEFQGCGYDGSLGRMFFEASIPNSISPIDNLSVYETFLLMLNEISLLWELVLLGESVLVYSQSPTQVGNAVLGLVSLIMPLRYGGEWRPYFTIHDKEFQSKSVLYNNNAIIGVTNPFFLKEWEDHENKVLLSNDAVTALDGISRPEPNSNLNASPDLISVKQNRDKLKSSSVPKARARRLIKSTTALDVHVTMLKTTYQPIMSDNYELLKTLVPLKRGYGVMDINAAICRANNRKIRRYFYERTQQFMIPLDSYFTSLMPVIPSDRSADHTAWRNMETKIKRWDNEQFLARIQSSSSLRGYLEAYKRFTASRTFDLWFYEKLHSTQLFLRSREEQNTPTNPK